MKKNALIVLGANGFLGGELILKCIKKNILTIGFTRKNENSKNFNLKELKILNYDFSKKNSLGITTKIKSLGLKNYNFTIINVAGPAHKNFKKSEYIFGISKFVKIVAKEAIDLNANLINVSSISARDYKLKKNTNIYFYGKQKYISEKIIIKLFKGSEKNISSISLRPPAIWGNEAKGSFKLLNKIVVLKVPLPISSINTKRSYIYVGSLIDNIINLSNVLMNKEKNVNGIFEISDGCYSLQEIIKKISVYQYGYEAKTFYFPKIFLKHILFYLNKRIYEQIFCKLKIDNQPLENFLNEK